jgi:3-oxoacyl-[acyl-carrier-protein] synthase II
MKRRRVKITGVGPVTPAGIGREAFWSGILQPISRVRPYTKLGPECGPLVAAYISSFDVFKYVQDRSRVPKGSSRQSLFAVASAVLALNDAGVSAEEFCHANAAIVVGSSLMDFGGIVGSIDAVQQKGLRGAQPRALYATGIASVPSAVNHALGASARTMAVSTQCCAGMDAIGYAVDLVASGEVEMALCGGCEAPLHRFPMLEFRAGELTPASDQLPERMSRPFDLWRTTGVVSEGACMFLLEPENSYRPGYSYVAGYAFGNDQPDGLCDGMEVSGKLAVAAAGKKITDVDVINAWGPGHKRVDVGEAQAMVKLFKGELAQIPAVSIKGSIGTPLGAAPAIQIASAVLAQRNGTIPPTVNWEFPDPACPLTLSNRPREIDHRVTLLNAHGVGGVNASLILEKC